MTRLDLDDALNDIGHSRKDHAGPYPDCPRCIRVRSEQTGLKYRTIREIWAYRRQRGNRKPPCPAKKAVRWIVRIWTGVREVSRARDQAEQRRSLT